MEELQEFKAALENAQEKGIAIFGEIVKAEFSRLLGAVNYKLAAGEQANEVAISAEEHEIEIMAAATAHQERVKAEKAEQEAAYVESIKTGDQTKIDLMVAKNKANVVAAVVDAISAEAELEKVVDELTSSAGPLSPNGGTDTESQSEDIDGVIPDSAVDEAPDLEIPAKGKK